MAARPLTIEEWFGAAGIDGPGGHALQDLLREERFIRCTRSTRAPRIEIYHDRIRETILKAIASEELRDHHRNLALALWKEHPDGADAEGPGLPLERSGE